jgi:sensor domain CHASE-containing protein
MLQTFEQTHLRAKYRQRLSATRHHGVALSAQLLQQFLTTIFAHPKMHPQQFRLRRSTMRVLFRQFARPDMQDPSIEM